MPGKRKPIEESWDRFAKAVLPPGVGDDQRADMKKAFYGGSFSLFKILMNETDDGEAEPTAANLDMMRDVEADIGGFMAKMERG